jgi:hypothetical protein
VAENSFLPEYDAASLDNLLPNFPMRVELNLQRPAGSRMFLLHPVIEDEGTMFFFSKGREQIAR